MSFSVPLMFFFQIDHEKMRNLMNWICATGITTDMHLIILIGFITLNGGGHAISLSGDLPCDFLNSMNISGGVTLTNGTVVYNDLEFPVGQYVRINYTFDSVMERVTVAPYMRGCICNREPCIRLCCPFGSVQVKSRQCEENDAAKSIEVFAEKFHNKSTTNIEPIRNFTFIQDYPCKRLHLINAEYIIMPV